MAHWWGFNREDSTKALQAAIDSGASIVVVKKRSSPWIIRPIKLRSNQTIILEDGVEIIAKKGAFKPIRDCLFSAVKCENIAIKGKNAKLIMHKSDYHDQTKYVKSEWRHGINLLSCENVLIEGLTIKDTGGDAIYLGSAGVPKNYCRNVRIERVICDGNNRQGISVISVENLLIKDCTLKNTSGTDPMAGIDFEPNHQNQRLVNCVVENCDIIANGRSGITTYIKLDRRSAPDISITIKNCRIKKNKIGVSFAVPRGRFFVKEPAKGFIRLVDCTIEDSEERSVQFGNFRFDSFKVVLSRCKLKNSSLFSPIGVIATPGISYSMGNIHFEDCIVTDKHNNPLIRFVSNFAPETKLVDINGTVLFNDKPVDIVSYIKQNKWDRVTGFASVAIELDKLKQIDSLKGESCPRAVDNLTFRSMVGFLIAGRKNQRVTFVLDYQLLRKSTRKMKLILESPTGEKTQLKDAVGRNEKDKNPFENKYSFVPKTTGVFKITGNPQGNSVNMKECSAPYSIALPKTGFLNLFHPEQPVYFDIPEGVSKIRILISGQDARETVDPAIKIDGKVVAKAKKVDAIAHLFDIAVSSSSHRQTGVIEFHNAVEDVMIKILGPLQPIISVNEKDLVIREFKTMP
ncbi:MAG: right-handed parallel beta-helix repeat-containing protein [Lentisphaeria bacterium]